MNAVGLALVCVICYSLNGALVDRFFKCHALWAQLLTNGVGPVFCLALIGGVYMTKTTEEIASPDWTSWRFWLVCLLCNVLLVGGGVSFCAALKEGSVTTVCSIVATLPIFATLVAMCLDSYFEEKIRALNPLQILAVLLVMGGVLLFIWAQESPSPPAR